MKIIKKAIIFTLCLFPIALISGALSGAYLLEMLPQEMTDEVMTQIPGKGLLVALTSIQTVGYAVVCGFFGYILSDKTGLNKPLKPDTYKSGKTLAISAILGIIYSLDPWTFGEFIDGIGPETVKITPIRIWASILYGGIIEEILLRLFMMSLLVFIFNKLFNKKKETVPDIIYVISNIVSALLFAAGHLPATAVLIGELTPLIVFRCFLLNGAFGVVFGHFYRKYGIIYSIMSHAVVHIVSITVWTIFI